MNHGGVVGDRESGRGRKRKERQADYFITFLIILSIALWSIKGDSVE